MPLPKSKNQVGLGRSIINRQYKDAQQRYQSGLHTTDLNDGPSWTKLQSVTQQGDLDEFLSTAQLAGTEFTAERRNVTVVQAPSVGRGRNNPYLLTGQEEKESLEKQRANKRRLRVPRRPAWTTDTTRAQLERKEKDAFLEWRRGLAELQEAEGLVLTPFERNIEVWRQLWRVVERSHLVVQIIDARNPLRFRCEDLEAYVDTLGVGSALGAGDEAPQGQVKGKRRNLLLVNKADLLTESQRKQWAAYFAENGIRYAFFSAANAAALQAAGGEEEASGVEAAEEDEDEDESEADEQDEIPTTKEARPANADEKSSKEDDPTRVLSVNELEELFMEQAPDLSDFEVNGNVPEKLVVGLVGYPNVGKSSTINALLGAKKVSVSSTPGKTKHFQTIHLSPSVVLCDCPGLVFPQFATTKADLVCDGVLPIDQMREYTGPATLVAERIPKEVLEATYGLRITTLPEEEGGTGVPTGDELLSSYAVARGFTRQGQGNPDESRAARYVLKDYINAKLLFCHPPPGVDADEFNAETRSIVKAALADRKVGVRPSASASASVSASAAGGDGDTTLAFQSYLEEEQRKEAKRTAFESAPAPAQGQKGLALDRTFFADPSSAGVASRPFVKGKAAAPTAGTGVGFSRVTMYPHQQRIGNDGRPIDASAGGDGEGMGSKKHFKGNKRSKQRSGKGYD